MNRAICFTILIFWHVLAWLITYIIIGYKWACGCLHVYWQPELHVYTCVHLLYSYTDTVHMEITGHVRLSAWLPYNVVLALEHSYCYSSKLQCRCTTYCTYMSHHNSWERKGPPYKIEEWRGGMGPTWVGWAQQKLPETRDVQKTHTQHWHWCNMIIRLPCMYGTCIGTRSLYTTST